MSIPLSLLGVLATNGLNSFLSSPALPRPNRFGGPGGFGACLNFIRLLFAWADGPHHSRRSETSGSNANIARWFNSWGSTVFIEKILLLKAGHWILHALKMNGVSGVISPRYGLVIYLCRLLPRFLSSGPLNQDSLYPETGFKFSTRTSGLLCGKRIIPPR